LDLKNEVYKILEKRRAEKVIAASLEAKVVLTLEEEKIKNLDQKALENILIVSELIVQSGPFQVEVTKAEGEKCVRCWKYSKQLDSEQLCPRCATAIK
jgi:isoleucyl-tRNA synthetase